MGASDIYVPMFGRIGPQPPNLPTQAHPNKPLTGVGSPESKVPSVPGTRYTDIFNGLVYIKISGSQTTGWQQVGFDPNGGGGGGGGGGGSCAVCGLLMSGHGPPSTNPGVPLAVYTDEDTSAQFWWFAGAWH